MLLLYPWFYVNNICLLDLIFVNLYTYTSICVFIKTLLVFRLKYFNISYALFWKRAAHFIIDWYTMNDMLYKCKNILGMVSI